MTPLTCQARVALKYAVSSFLGQSGLQRANSAGPKKWAAPKREVTVWPRVVHALRYYAPTIALKSYAHLSVTGTGTIYVLNARRGVEKPR